jgi:glycosyltransferase involved in cell wall biosynthesis/spore maturation protein CgeB
MSESEYSAAERGLLQRVRQLQAENERLERLRQQAETQLALTRGSASFQLGQLLIRSLRRPLLLLQLPTLLLALYREARGRRPRRWSPPAPQRRILPQRAAPDAAPPARLRRPVSSAAELKQLTVAAILDDFSAQCFAPECRLTQLTAGEWPQQLAAETPDLLLVESAWQGAAGSWQGKISHSAAELRALLAWCRRHGVPTVFWNKEDPVHFATFLTTAALFDYVFTTDLDCIGRYQAALGHRRVGLLPFAAQPTLHHPLERYARKDAFCFAGAYYLRYPERTRDLGNLIWELAALRPLEIFDRNFAKDDANYRFPAEYQPFIVGTLPYAEIDRAYKGYRYAINLNTIKQSPSMFARRVFELLASNTITLSNYSYGLRLLFGDLVLSSDDGSELLRRLQPIAADETAGRRLRLAGLRKVFGEHTYQDRLAQLVGRLQDAPLPPLLPTITVIAAADDAAQLARLLANYQRQRYPQRRLQLVVPAALAATVPGAPDIRVSAWPRGVSVAEWLPDAPWLAGMLADDEYGPEYLTDLALATRYSTADAIGKATHYRVVDGAVQLCDDGLQYRPVPQLAARAALLRTALIADQDAASWLRGLAAAQLSPAAGLTLLAIDEFDYCRDGALLPTALELSGSGLPGRRTGLPLARLYAAAGAVTPAVDDDSDLPAWRGDVLGGLFRSTAAGSVRLQVVDETLQIVSTLPDGSHEYLYARHDYPPHELGAGATLQCHLISTPGLQLQLVLIFLDQHGRRLGSELAPANSNLSVALPAGTQRLRFGLRVYAGGSCNVRSLLLGRRAPQQPTLLSDAPTLLISNHYPSYDDRYRNAFVHSRVRAYRAAGAAVDVFRLRPEPSYHEHENIDVISGSPALLQQLLSDGRPRTLLVHFLDEALWQVLQHQRGRIVVWLHGAEIHHWQRRSFNLQSDAQRERAQQQSEQRMAFWRGLLREPPDNLQLVFVSRSFAEEVMADLGFRLPAERYRILHNPIDTALFQYRPKPPAQRLKVLAIRPYASRQYANDLTVAALLRLSREPFFGEFEFRLIGDGPLFDETLAPLRGLRNVIIERGFLAQHEIAALHRDYGVFLVPTRWDSQGVSRDEAMASGLVPMTTAVAAVPEFLDKNCGFLTPAEDAAAIAQALTQLYHDPQLFLRLSQNAAARVREQSAQPLIIAQELALFAAPAEEPS